MSGAFLIGRRDDGKDIPVSVTDDGAVKVDIEGASLELDAAGVEIKNDVGSPIPTLPLGIISTGNSTSANLAAGATFTGEGIDASPAYGTVSVCVFSSHASATNGLKFQASIDNISWETIEQYTYIAGSGLQSYSFAPSGRYFRLTYTNGGTETTKFAVFSVLRSGYTKSSSHRIGDVITGEKDAELVKAVLAAMKPNGDFTDIHCTAGGNLKISLEEVNGIDPLPVTSGAYKSSATVVRPSNTTDYAIGDVIGVADSGTPANAGSAIIEFASIGPSGGYVLLRSVQLMVGLGDMPSGMAGFRLHFYTASPTAILDNAAFDLVSGDVVDYAGYVDLSVPEDMGSTLFTQADKPETLIKLAAGQTSLWAQLETRGAYTPASGTTYSLNVLALEAGL